MNDDIQLLRRYAQEGSDEAFREVVERHIQLVYATARRMVAGDAHLAEDVTQVVFTDLARKATTLSEDVLLGGWLHRHTCFTAAKAVRTEQRRRNRERTAMEMNAVNDNTGSDAHWEQLAPVLDAALNHLSASDRDAVVMRYLQRRDMRSIGATLGTSENAVQKRLGRALEKLRSFLTRRGIVLSTALLATTLDGRAALPVPHGLAASVSAKALAGAAAASTSLTLTSILHTMIKSKLVLGFAATAAVAAAATIAITQSGTSTTPAPAPIIHAAAPVAQPAPAKVEAPVLAAAPAPAPALTNDSDVFSGRVPDAPPPPVTGAYVMQKSGQGTITLSSGSSGQVVHGGTLTFSNGAMLNVNGVSGGTGTLVVTPDGNTVDADNTTFTTADGSTVTVQQFQSADGSSHSGTVMVSGPNTSSN